MKANVSQCELSTAMRKSVEDLYAVFRRYKAPEYMLDVCINCCMDAKLEAEMRRMPLRSIPARYFYEYNCSAKSALQPVDEIKYLLPRLLELLASGAELHHSTELYLQRIGNCEAIEFSNQERAALDAFALCYFDEALSRHPWQDGNSYVGDEVFDVLLMFDCGGFALRPLLDYWLANETTAATLHYVSSGFYDFWQGQRVQNAFAQDRPQFQETLKAWLIDESHRSVFARRIAELDMSAIDPIAVRYYGSQITPKEMAETVFDLITC